MRHRQDSPRPDRGQRDDRDYPKYRDMWKDIREGLKEVRRGPEDAHKPPLLPGLLEGALKSLYGHYATKFAEWDADEESKANGSTPLVFIVVCNNTNVSKAVFDYVAGYETEHMHADGEPGRAYEEAVSMFDPYERVQEPDPSTRAALRQIAEQCVREKGRAYVFVNNRLEGNAPATIEAVVSDESSGT